MEPKSPKPIKNLAIPTPASGRAIALDAAAIVEIARSLIEIGRIAYSGQQVRTQIQATMDLITSQHTLDMGKVDRLLGIMKEHVDELPHELRQEYLAAIPRILTAASIKVEIRIEGKTYIITSQSLDKKGPPPKG